MRLRRLAPLTAALALALVAGSACSSKKPSATESPSPEDSAGSATSPASPSSAAPALLSPLTGLAIRGAAPVVVLKIDNGPLARPYFIGLDKADVMYEELVEGGTTRLMGVFSANANDQIGPIRSVRESDLELIREYGRVLFGFSGGNDGLKRIVASAPVINASYDAVPEGTYVLGARRRDARNFFVTPAKLIAVKPGGELVKDIGLRFGPLPATVGTAAVALTLPWSDRARTSFDYDPATKRWLRSMDGAPSKLSTGARISAPNVIIQYVSVRNGRFRDVTGAPSPYSTTVGGGVAEVFRDGVRITGRWTRPSAVAGTRFVDAAGKDILLQPGPVWILLAPNTVRVAVR